VHRFGSANSTCRRSRSTKARAHKDPRGFNARCDSTFPGPASADSERKREKEKEGERRNERRARKQQGVSIKQHDHSDNRVSGRKNVNGKRGKLDPRWIESIDPRNDQHLEHSLHKRVARQGYATARNKGRFRTENRRAIFAGWAS